MSKIYFSQLHAVEHPEQFKLHFGRWNKISQPLDEWVRDHSIWNKWQEYRPTYDEFNRQYIFSMMYFYPERDSWLFGGIFEVTGRHPDRYGVLLTDVCEEYVGRLKIYYPYLDRNTRPKFEKHYGKLEVAEILREPYSGRVFPGYENIDLTFSELETLVLRGRPDWKQALELAKGIYLITDTKTEKRYVGSAYGNVGIWSRWSNYVVTGHGGNVELRALVPAAADLEYCRTNFRFSLLEFHMNRVSDETIITREVFWKDILRTRHPLGLNRN